MQDAELNTVLPERRKTGALRLPVTTLPQPDETTCGPTCLHTVYRYWGEDEPLGNVIARAYRLEHGGTLAVFLACDALRKGYRATIYTYNITVFDLEFLRLGGELCFTDLTVGLLHGILRRRLPIITGLSATYLYRSPRECEPEGIADDVAGHPVGHFAVLAGFNTNRGSMLVVDPYQPTPYGPSHAYWISVDRVLGSILLGIVTHDANLLVVHLSQVQTPGPSGEPINHFEPL